MCVEIRNKKVRQTFGKQAIQMLFGKCNLFTLICGSSGHLVGSWQQNMERNIHYLNYRCLKINAPAHSLAKRE